MTWRVSRHAMVATFAVTIAGCSAGSSGPMSGGHAATTAAVKATGIVSFTLSRKKITAKHTRKPVYISAGTVNANLSIDGAITPGSCLAGVCTISWTSTPGSHTFTAEIDDGTYILAAGSQTYTLTAGVNTLGPLTLNGVAAQIVFPTGAGDAAGTFSIADADGDAIVLPGSFDNLSAIGVSSGVIGGIIVDLPATAGYLDPDSSGSDYTFTASCASGSTGTFTIQATTAAPVASGIVVSQFAGLTYPSISVSADTYQCSNGIINPAYGTLRFQPNGTFTEYAVPTTYSSPEGITAGPDGALWFVETMASRIGRISTTGSVSEYVIPSSNSYPTSIAAGSDNALWFTEINANKIGRITTSGVFTEYTVPTANSILYGIAAGSDGALWFTERYTNNIGRVTTSGVFTEYPVPSANSAPSGIASGPDGALWFTEQGGATNRIGRVTTTGAFTEYVLPTQYSYPTSITSGPDSALWFTEEGGNDMIGRISTSGSITEYPIPTSQSEPAGIITGPDGALWFTELNVNQIGRIATSGVITEWGIPTSQSAPYGIALGTDGALWFTEETGNNIGRLLP